MKKIVIILCATLMLGALSCSKDDPAPAALLNLPEAKAEHDNKSGGVYKGTFANATTTGTMKVVLQEGKTEIILVYNGTTKTLTTSDLSGWTSGDAIVNATFQNGDWIVMFSVSADGTVMIWDFDLSGETNFVGVLNKELSTAIVKVYEGTYTGDDSGKWNFNVQQTTITGLYSGGSNDNLMGTLTGTTIVLVSTGADVNATGTMTGEGASCSGTWTTSSSSGTWTGSRKM